MEKIRAVIVDDEKHASETLVWELERACPQVEIVAIFNAPLDALAQLPELNPDLLFLDVEMPKLNGFELLQKLGDIEFGVIFTTAYDQFALKAIKYSAVDYILKPVDQEELKKAVGKFEEGSRKSISTRQMDILFRNLEKKGFDKIALPTSDGLEFVEPEEIMHCESDSNYTYVYFKNGSKSLISKTLKEIEELLDGHGFIRVHHSHIVNLKHIRKYVRGSGGYLELVDGNSVSVSRSRKEDLMKLF